VESSSGGRRHAQLAAVYISVCLLLSVLAFVPQDTSEVFYFVLFVVMLPISLTAFFISYIGGVMIFGPGDLPTWARVAEALVWTSLAAVQAFAFLALCRTGGKRASA
jgi:hypothetical protein